MDENLITTVLKHRESIPAAHPMEQTLAYLAMLSDNDEHAGRLSQLHRHLPFPPNIVKTIQLILALQVAHHRGQPVASGDVREVEDSLTSAIAPHWRRYGLIRALQACVDNPGGRRSVGPMEVLPFNYA